MYEGIFSPKKMYEGIFKFNYLFFTLKKGIKEFLEKWKSNFFIKKIEA